MVTNLAVWMHESLREVDLMSCRMVWGVSQGSVATRLGFRRGTLFNDHFKRWLQLRFDFDSTAVRLLIKVIKVTVT